MYTEQELRDAIRCAACISLKLYSSKEKLEEAMNSLANDKVREMVASTVLATRIIKQMLKDQSFI